MKTLALFIASCALCIGQSLSSSPVAAGGTGGGGGGGSTGTFCNATGGASNTLVCAGSPVPTSYAAGMIVSLKVDATNTGAVTLNISGLGAQNVFSAGAALSASTLLAGSGTGNIYTLAYDGSRFNLGIAGPTGPAGAAGQSTVSFLVCSAPCVVGDASNWKWTVPAVRTVTSCTIDAAVYPTGAAVTVNVLKNAIFAGYGVLPQWTGGTTIFTSTLPTLAAGGTTFNTQSGMAAAAAMAAGDNLVASVTGVGSTIAGQGVNVTCAIQ